MDSDVGVRNTYNAKLLPSISDIHTTQDITSLNIAKMNDYRYRGTGGAMVSNQNQIKSQNQISSQNQINNEEVFERNMASAARNTNSNSHNLFMGTAGMTATSTPGGMATKIRLIITLQKLNTMGVPYALVSQFFQQGLGQANTNSLMFFQSMLVYDNDTLKDSTGCYASTLSAIQKTQSTDYSPLADLTSALSSIITDLK